MIKQKFGFTLAEVLIVIGIIGVVAALTLPNLNHATGDKEKVTKVKKIYSSLSDAIDRASAIYGNLDTWKENTALIQSFARNYPSTSSEGNGGKTGGKKDDNYLKRGETALFSSRILEFLKISKDCGFAEGCFSSAPLEYYFGGYYTENYLNDLIRTSTYMVILNDGTSLGFHFPLMTDDLFSIRVDLDGPNKGKNQMGNDIFTFAISTEENVNKGLQLLPDAQWDGSYEGHFYGPVTAWVIENGNLDYLKCPDELNWETKTSCE